LLAYRDVKVSARLLGIALILEVIMLAIFSLGVLMTSQVTNFTAESLNVFKVFTPVAEQTVGTVAVPAGAAAVGVFMAFWSWVGFEMAPNYAEESRDPKRIIPLSLLISVIGLGVFYTFVSWCAVAAYPTEADMVAKAFSNGVDFFLTPIHNFVGGWAYELMSILILTSSFACGMAFHNTASRYLYSLGREGVLPKMVAETHDHHKSPHKASAVQSVLAAVWVLLYGFSYGFDDPSGQAWLGVYTLFAVLGTGLLLVLQAVVSLAIFVWFKNNGGGNVLTTVVAPLISLVVQLILVYTLVANLATLGGTNGFARSIPYVALAILAVGLVWGFLLKSANPKAYANIGRMVNDEA
jgi:amino acid transporter